jgi:peptide chain release factor 2
VRISPFNAQGKRQTAFAALQVVPMLDDDEIRGDQQRVGFGSQIRSYVLQPYQMVKDLRSEHETGNVSAVLDGDLDPFMESYLQWRRSGGATG